MKKTLLNSAILLLLCSKSVFGFPNSSRPLLPRGNNEICKDKEDGEYTVEKFNGNVYSKENDYVVGYCKDGHPSGVWKRYNKDGTLEAEEEWSSTRGRHGKRITYFDGSKDRASCELYEDGRIVERYEYWGNGKVKHYRKLLKGTGYWYGKTDNIYGDLIREKKEDGTCIQYYYSSGKIQKVEHIETKSMWAKKDGDFYELFEDGKLMEKGTYVNGARQGLNIECDREGNCSECNYKHNLLDGECITKDKKGKIISKVMYVNGSYMGGESYK